MRIGYNPKNVKIKTDTGITVDRAFLAHLVFNGPIAADDDAVLAAANLGEEALEVTTGINAPDYPRALSIAGNVSGIAGDVAITGTNYAGEAITETLALNGAVTVNGVKAFKTVDQIDLPVQTHTPTAQVETATVAGTITTAGNAAVTVTAAGMANSPKAISAAVELNDDASAIGAKIRAALAADEDVAALFEVGGTGIYVVLTALAPDANDETLNIAIADDTSEGITEDATSDNSTAGVPYDAVSVGVNEILGLPYKLASNTILPGMTFLNNVRESVEPAVTVSLTDMESNTVDLNSALDGSQVDIYLIV